MKVKVLAIATAVLFFKYSFSQEKSDPLNTIQHPKLVVGIVIDQMRWDYLYRFYDLYAADGGFKRLMTKGFNCENTLIPYTPTLTAPGHACVYTGSVPAIHGITGNNWFNKISNKNIYCTDDDSAYTIGANDNLGKMSPENLLTTTITDELRIATDYKSKVIGIAIKDRGAILPAGHAANAAYWYDSNTGNFISSSYYEKALPAWVQAFNNRKIVDSLYALNWNASLSSEVMSKYYSADNQPYEHNPFANAASVIPYNLSSFIKKDYSRIAYTPQGNDLTLELAKAAITGENLGNNTVTDFLAISISSTDYIGHSFGPNSWEQLDDFIKLDKVLGEFLNFLDAKIGNQNYTVFLTADHGVANSPGYIQQHNLPGGSFNHLNVLDSLNKLIKDETGADNIITGMMNYQVILNDSVIREKNIDKEKVTKSITDYLNSLDAVSEAFDIREINSIPMNEWQRQMLMNGYYKERSGDIQIVLKPGYVGGVGIGTSHGSWNPYDSHIPLLWYGWGIKPGKSYREVYMTDIAPTLASLLHIQMPSGCVGKTLVEVLKDDTN